MIHKTGDAAGFVTTITTNMQVNGQAVSSTHDVARSAARP
jgi:hypothetical protein